MCFNGHVNIDIWMTRHTLPDYNTGFSIIITSIYQVETPGYVKETTSMLF